MPQPAACPVLSARAEPTSTKARAPSSSWALFKHLDLMSVWDPAGFKAKKPFCTFSLARPFQETF